MLISVIIPIYKVEDTLERAVRSVMNQTYKKLEIILVDDGSPDQSGAIADRMAEEDPRIKVIHKENGGLSDARNAGIDQARGEYIAFLDSDDEFDQDIMQVFINHFNDQPMDMFIFNYERVFLDTGKREVKEGVNGIFRSGEAGLEAILTHKGLDFFAWNKIYHSSLFANVRYPVGKLYEDSRVSYQTIIQCERVVTSKKVGIYYYENSQSIVSQDFNPRQMDNVTERILIHDDIAKRFPKLKKYSADRLLDGILSTAYKLSKAEEPDAYAEYDQALKQYFKDYQKDFRESKQVDWKKLAAFRLYQFNPNLYAKAYELYLGK